MKPIESRQATSPAQPHPEKGQGLIEFALVIPFLIMVVIGLLDLGRMYFTVIIINNAAREGARYLIQYPDDKEGTNPCDYYHNGVWLTYNGQFSQTKCAAIREAEYSTPKIVDLEPGQVTIPLCDDDLNGVADDICDTEEPIRVTVTYNFDPILWPGTLTFQRSVEMLVP